MEGLLSLFRRRPQILTPKPSAQADGLPLSGYVAPCLFSHEGELVHAMCKVEERDETSLLLRVLREMGKVSLAGLPVGAKGQIEVAGQLIPTRVLRVQLPWIVVSASPERSRPVLRQFFRVPASFTVQFRLCETDSPWLTGRGVDVSSGGFCFTVQEPEVPRLGVEYLTKLAFNLTRSQEKTLDIMTAAVRWVTMTDGEISVGVRVVDPARCKDLAKVVSHLQHLLARYPEDYLLIESQRPRFRS